MKTLNSQLMGRVVTSIATTRLLNDLSSEDAFKDYVNNKLTKGMKSYKDDMISRKGEILQKVDAKLSHLRKEHGKTPEECEKMKEEHKKEHEEKEKKKKRFSEPRFLKLRKGKGEKDAKVKVIESEEGVVFQKLDPNSTLKIKCNKDSTPKLLGTDRVGCETNY